MTLYIDNNVIRPKWHLSPLFFTWNKKPLWGIAKLKFNEQDFYE